MINFRKLPAAALRFPPARIILGGAAVFGFPALVNGIVFKPLQALVSPEWRGADALRYLAAMAVSWGFYVLFFRMIERRRVVEAEPAGLGRDGALGFLLGFGSIALAFGLCAVFGIYAVAGINRGFDWVRVPFVVAGLAFIEELTFRGVAFRIAEKWLGTLPALGLSALFFGLAHAGNAGMNPQGLVSAVLGGTVASLAFSLSGKVWLPSAFHFGWNFAQVVFGSNVSGMSDWGSVFKGSLEGPDILTGGGFGIEASLVTLVLLAGLSAALLLAARRAGRIKPRPPRKDGGNISSPLPGPPL